MVLFSKFGKTVKDLFKTDKYELNRTISVNCASGNTEWTTECSFPVADGEQTTELAKYKLTDSTFGNIEIEIPNVDPKKVDYQFPKYQEGLKVNFVVEEEKSKTALKEGGAFDGAKFSLKGEYIKDKLAGKACLAAGSNKSLQAELAYELSEGCWVGGEVKYVMEKDMDYSAGVHLPLGNMTIDGKYDIRKQNANVKLHQSYCDTGAVAAEFNYDVEKMNASTSLGGAWKLDDNCNLQGYVKNTGNTYLLFKYKVSEHITASAGTSFDLSKMQQDGVDVHCKINIEA